ncbi:hypothetical protein BLNAU_9530 [Blattamonas nauphoetae]|uniref:Uncharacterized protein n=1 Tax=Blattamonas nauphoetae TaxID=2049346 RepID=A0ABQ9XVG7_9EUKA|nr:hypothetical protein BLNAU_9530 [Blattamonas nauphoetae]
MQQNLTFHPIIVTLSSSGRSEVTITSTKHESASIGTLLPLVRLTERTDSETEESAEVIVTGANLEINHVDLCLGTGPLVDFGERNEGPDVSAIITTILTNSAILNTTSTSAPHPFTPLPTISQSVIGCSIAESTNHFTGTSTLNVNHAQHFSAINTTVTACHDSLQSNDDYTNKNYTTRPYFTSSTTAITRGLFKGCFSTYSEGGAVGFDSYNSITIAECSFTDCYCSSASTGVGGALFVDEYMWIYEGPKTTITKSSVANCRAHWGSAVCLSNHQTIVISEFVVENCSKLEMDLSSKKTGLGALLISTTDGSVSVSNSLFSHCHNDHAGSLFLNGSLLQNTFNSVAFRGSSVEKGDNSRDFATTLPSTAELTSMFSNCDSTSASGNEIDVTIHGANFEDGTYQVVLQKVGEDSTKTFNFGRQFGELLYSAVAYPEESAELEYNTQYTLVSVSWEGKLLDRSVETSVFTTPVDPARLSGIGEVQFTEGKKAVSLPFTSSGLSPSTKYKMVVDSIPKGAESTHSRTLNFTTDNLGSLTSSVQTVYPQTTLLPSFGTEYTVRSFALSSGTSFIALSSIKFSIPDEPSRLTSVAISYESNETVAVVTISGRVLSQQDHTLLLKNIADETDTPKISIVYSSTGSGSWSAKLSLVNTPLLKYGQTYTVTAFKVGGESGDDVLVEGTLTVAVTTEPAVVNDLSFHFDEGTQSTGKLVFSTVRMPISTNLVVTVEGETTFNLTGYLTFSTAESGSIAATLFSTTKTVQLEYGKTYTISKIVVYSPNKEVFFTGKREFTIPKADPRVVSLKSSEWLDDGRGMTYTFYSVGLEDEEHEMELTDTTAGAESEPVVKLTLSVGVDGGRQIVQGTAFFFPVDTATLKYSHTYKVTKITRKSKPTEEILTDTITLSVAAQQASITTVTCAMQAGTYEKNVSVSFEGVGSFNSYFYPVYENEGVLIEPMSLIFSGTKATQSIQIYGSSTSPNLEYGKTYKLVRVRASSSTAVPLLLTKDFQIEIPAEKPRVTSVSSTNSTDGYSIALVFSTRLLEAGGSYDFAVSSSSHSAVITATVAGSGTSQKATVAVSLNNDGTGQLYNNATYTLKSVTKSAPKSTQNEETEIIVETVTFKTPVISPSISNVIAKMDTANGERNVIIRLEGANLNTSAYTTVYIGSSSIASFIYANTSTWMEFYVKIYDQYSPNITYGSQYTITRVSNGVDCALLKTLSFEVPAEKPRLAYASVEGASDFLTCTITFTTRLLEVGASYNILMSGSPASGTGPEHTGYITATVSTVSSGQRAVAAARLSEDGKNADLFNAYSYVPTEVVKTSGEIVSNIIIDNFVVTTPGAPKVTSVKAYFTPGSYEQNLTIEFGGSGLGDLYSQIVTVNDGTKNIQLNGYLEFDSDTVGTIRANLTGSYAQLEYGKTYSVVKIAVFFWGDTPTLKEGLEFEVPQEKPHLLSVSKQTNATDVTSTTLTFKSSGLEDGANYEITLSGTPSTTTHTAILTVVPSTTSETQTATGTAILSPPEEASLWHGMTYTPISMKKVNSENEHTSVVIHSMTFKTASDNRKVSSCGVGFTDVSERSLRITLSGSNLPANSAFIVTIDATTPFDLKESGVFSSTSEGSVVATTFQKGQPPELEYGKTYKIKSMRYEANGAPVVISSTLTIPVPESSSQIIQATCRFDNQTDTAVVTLYGNHLKDAEMTVEVSDENDVRINSITKTVFNEHTNTLSVIFATSEEDQANCLFFGQLYTVEAVGVEGESSIKVIEDVSFKLKHTPKIAHVDFAFTNKMGTKAQLTLNGTDFPENEVLTATLTGGITFTVTSSDDDTAVSEPIVVGFENTLEFESEYAFVSLTLPGDDFNMFDVSSSHFVTNPRPVQSEFVVEEGDVEGKDCGEEKKPCGSIWKVIELSEELGMKNVVVDLKGDISQTTALTIHERSSLTIQNFTQRETTLIVPRTASQGEKKGLVSVYEASLTLKNLTVSVSGSTSVTCLVFGMGGTFVVEQCSVFVEKTDLAQEINTNAVVCSWQTGLFNFEKSTLHFISSSFEDVEQGVVAMDGGSLVVQNCEFHKNGKTFDEFPTMRQNIDCRNEATIEITTVESTDEPLWIAADNCTVVKDSIELKAPMFVPTFDVKTTKVEFEKENDKFVVRMKGTLLIPCGLKLEIYEMFSNKTATGNGKLIELTGANTADWTETGFVATILHSQLKPDLDVSYDWHMRLSYGQDELSSASMKFKDRTKKAAATVAIVVPTVVFVLVCVIVGCIVGCVCVRRRVVKQHKYRQYQNKSSVIRTPSQGDLTDGDDVVKYGGMDEDEFNRGSINTPALDVDDGKA